VLTNFYIVRICYKGGEAQKKSAQSIRRNTYVLLLSISALSFPFFLLFYRGGSGADLETEFRAFNRTEGKRKEKIQFRPK
jgi:hypothetical protein